MSYKAMETIEEEITSDDDVESEGTDLDEEKDLSYSTDSSSVNPPKKKINNSIKFENKSKYQYEQTNCLDTSSSDDNDINEECFSNLNWGPVTVSDSNSVPFEFIDTLNISQNVYHDFHLQNAYDFYKLFVSTEVIELMVNETNRYANDKQNKNKLNFQWTDTNIAEMEIFLGTLMFLVDPQLLYVEKYYREHLEEEVIPIMDPHRFQHLLKMWHFCNNKNETRNRIRKINVLLNLLEKNFQSAVTPSNQLFINESIIPFKFGLKNNNRYRYGLRYFNLCLTDGYIYKIALYFGNNLEIKPNQISSYIIKKFLKELLDKGHTLITSKNLTSIPLAQDLLNHNTYIIGLLSSKSKFIPKEIKSKQLKRGESIRLQSNTGIVLQKWKNQHSTDMLVINTKYSDEMVLTYETNGTMLEQPRSIFEYRKYVTTFAATDIFLKEVQLFQRHCSHDMKWYTKLAIELLVHTAAANAFLLYKNIFPNQDMDLITFKKRITDKIFVKHAS